LSRYIWKDNLKLALSYTHCRADSNLDFAEYRRNIYGLAVSANYQGGRMKKLLSPIWNSIQTGGLVLLLTLAFSAPCAADWELDLRIDRELGIFDQSWCVPLTRLRTRFDLPAAVRPGPPPYPQQVNGAQQFPVMGQQQNPRQ
jgi:hypothetical protein